MKKNRIAIYLNDFSLLGGVERVSYNLARLFLKNNQDFHSILSLKQTNINPDIKFNELNVNVFECNSVRETKFSSQFVDYIDSNQIKFLILQVQELEEAHFICTLSKKLRCKIIPVLHASPHTYTNWFFPSKYSSVKAYLRYIKMIFYSKPKHINLFRKIIDLTQIMLCVSESSANELKTMLKTDNDKISFVFNPLSFSSVSHVDFDKKHNTLIYVGRLSPEKHPIQMLQIWKIIHEKHPTWNFQILGHGISYNIMHDYIVENKLKNVELLGAVTNVETFLEKSKICILLSYFEGLPTSLLEAASYGNVLLGYKSFGGVSDVIQSDFNGFLKPLGDLQGITDDLDHLIHDNILLKKMSKNSIKKVSEFSDENILNQWQNYL